MVAGGWINQEGGGGGGRRDLLLRVCEWSHSACRTSSLYSCSIALRSELNHFIWLWPLFERVTCESFEATNTFFFLTVKLVPALCDRQQTQYVLLQWSLCKTCRVVWLLKLLGRNCALNFILEKFCATLMEFLRPVIICYNKLTLTSSLKKTFQYCAFVSCSSSEII